MQATIDTVMARTMFMWSMANVLMPGIVLVRAVVKESDPAQRVSALRYVQVGDRTFGRFGREHERFRQRRVRVHRKP